MIQVSSNRGSLHLPLSLMLLLVFSFGTGLIHLRNQFHSGAKIQLDLDFCVVKTISQLRRNIGNIESLNAQIVKARGAVTFAPTEILLRTALQTLFFLQEGLKNKWIIKSSLPLSCPTPTFISNGFPKWPWVRQPPDQLGPQPLNWARPKSFYVGFRGKKRSSGGQLSWNAGHADWTARWTIHD